MDTYDSHRSPPGGMSETKYRGRDEMMDRPPMHEGHRRRSPGKIPSHFLLQNIQANRNIHVQECRWLWRFPCLKTSMSALDNTEFTLSKKYRLSI